MSQTGKSRHGNAISRQDAKAVGKTFYTRILQRGLLLRVRVGGARCCAVTCVPVQSSFWGISMSHFAPLVNVAWLSEQLNSARLVLLDASMAPPANPATSQGR